MLDLSGARATATSCAPEEMNSRTRTRTRTHRRAGAGDVGRAVPRVPEYPERGEALVEGRRHGEIAGVHHVLDRGGEGGVEHQRPEGRH
jgi:hypothetical protein